MKVFISHTFTDEDQELASKLQKMLEEENIEGYLAEKRKEYDLLIRDKIRKEIEKSDHMVAIVTNKAKESASVNQEIGYALREGIKPIIMLEQNAKEGVLTHGVEVEEFRRDDFENSCAKIKEHIMKKGIRKKISDDDKKELIANVYRPCYNQMMNAYNNLEFITMPPADPYENIEHYWKLKAEEDGMKPIFDLYSKELLRYGSMWTDFANKFIEKRDILGEILRPVFEKYRLLEQNGDVNFGGIKNPPREWLHNCQDVIFNDTIQNGEELFRILKKDAERKYGEKYSQFLDEWKIKCPNIFTDLLQIIPELVKTLGAKYSYRQLDEQLNILKNSIEKLTMTLREKLQGK